LIHKMRYRLGLDLGTTSLGWALVRLSSANEPVAIIRAGVRIFSDGRNPKDGSSLAVTRRDARSMRRRRDRLLKRKTRLMAALIELGFFPKQENDRKLLQTLDPYAIRAAGLDRQLTASEFARALFHINQRRGFKSNRKTDKADNEAGALKSAISNLRVQLQSSGMRTVGEWLNRRNQSGQTVRARFRQTKVAKPDGKSKIEKSYDLYIDRAMIEQEFDLLWAAQTRFDSVQFSESNGKQLKEILLFQRNLKPVKPGRCTLLPDQERAAAALPSTQRFRIYQEINNLRFVDAHLAEAVLTLEQRNIIVDALEKSGKKTFTAIRKALGVDSSKKFNIEDAKRTELKGNSTSATLAKNECFGADWYALNPNMQDEIVQRILKDEDESQLITWLMTQSNISEQQAETIANVSLVPGYGALSLAALNKIVPELQRDVITYDKAVLAAGFAHHSQLNPSASGEILECLPYYGEPLQRHVGFGTGDPNDPPEKRFGKIANPTVHIALNQVRLIVNELIKRYGHPSEIIVELARDLKQSKAQKDEDNKRQAENQKRNGRMRDDIAKALGISNERVKGADLQKMILWEELSDDIADRKCPYSGAQISMAMLLGPEVEIEHILPFSQTLDDSLNNKTVALRQANRLKGNSTPWQAFGAQSQGGIDFQDILLRAKNMPLNKRYRFGEDGYERWLKEDKGFLARALNDTRYLSRVAREYVSLICPANTRVVPGLMTALLRGKYGLDRILSTDPKKNRNDHRHHAVDACVIAITDQGLLQRFAKASADARQKQLGRLVEDMPLPWDTFQAHVQRAIEAIVVSHKPDHNYEGAMHLDTAYGLRGGGMVSTHKTVDGVREYVVTPMAVIEFSSPSQKDRHGVLPDGQPRPYKGYSGNSNYCMEIVKNEKGKWVGEVISTFEAYQIVRQKSLEHLRNPRVSQSGRPLVMRLCSNDFVKFKLNNEIVTLRIARMNSAGQFALIAPMEANVDARNREKTLSYVYKTAGALQPLGATAVSVSPLGVITSKP
jgi:CRISPR-associated endonuclease Csn1